MQSKRIGNGNDKLHLVRKGALREAAADNGGVQYQDGGLCINDKGMPDTAQQRMAIANKLMNGLTKNGVPVEDIYVDPLVQPMVTQFLRSRISAGH